MAEHMWWGNARVTPWMHYRLTQLDADLFREFGVHLVANSGIRLASEQEAIWYARMTLTPNGRRVYGTRRWNGRLWYLISNQGVVAPPKTSNHEIQGEDAAVDIVDTGSDAGITNRNSTRGRWIRANAWKYDLVAEGDSFGEGWHFKALRIFRTPPTNKPAPAPAVVVPNIEGNEMLYIAYVMGSKTKPNGRFLVQGRGDGVPTAVALSGDAVVAGVPTVEIKIYHEQFWSTVELR